MFNKQVYSDKTICTAISVYQVGMQSYERKDKVTYQFNNMNTELVKEMVKEITAIAEKYYNLHLMTPKSNPLDDAIRSIEES